MEPVGKIIGFALGAIVALHFLEPQLGITWSYAHLSRTPFLPWVGGALVVALPLASRRLWRTGWPARALTPWPPALRIAAGVLLFAALAVIGRLLPAPNTSMDAGLFLAWVEHGGEVARWHLLLKMHQGAAAVATGIAEPDTIVRLLNALFAALAILALGATARALARDRGEALAMTALSLSAMGVLQLCIGYADVYPLPLAAMAIYLFSSLAVIGGRLHPVYPMLLVAVGPFTYLGLVLLAPSLIIVVACALRTRGGLQRIAVGGAVATVVGGAATLPRFGSWFAWGPFLSAIDDLPATHMGLNPEGYSLPLEQVASAGRLEEVFHLLLLVDPVGWVLLLATSAFAASQWRRPEAPTLAFLALLVAPYLAFVVAMDPLYGAYGDWDLFSYGAVATSVAGGFGFVLWGRAHPKHFPLLLGLALACASVHLLARLHALDVDAERHLRESPSHISHGTDSNNNNSS